MYRFNYPAEKFDENNINTQDLLKLIREHESYAAKMKLNDEYYKGKHNISLRKRDSGNVNNRIICNHARYISDIATGYFMGNPISYSSNEDISALTAALKIADTEKTDSTNALNMSKYGLAYEYIYVGEGITNLKTKSLSPLHTFLVYDDSIDENPLFAVYYYVRKNDVDSTKKYAATVLTANLRLDYELSGGCKGYIPKNQEEHHLGCIPVIEYKNNEDAIGDFEQVISIIDAYNVLMSDRVNDKEQFVNSILVLYGVSMADDEDGASQAAKALKRLKLLELPEDARAEYLHNTLDETGAEVLRKALEQDIHKFAYVPCLSDECFSGNSSGVAMEYKLLGLEMITKTKTNFYKEGLRKRLEAFCNFLSIKAVAFNVELIDISFTRGLPKNLLETAQIVSTLDGLVSQKTLLGQIPFVKDPDAEVQELESKRDMQLKQTLEGFEGFRTDE